MSDSHICDRCGGKEPVDRDEQWLRLKYFYDVLVCAACVRHLALKAIERDYGQHWYCHTSTLYRSDEDE